MSEVSDLVMPLLQTVQADLAEIKREIGSVRTTLDGHTDKLEEIEIYLAYETGLGSQNKADVQFIKSKIRAVEQRLKALEPQT